jgi:hypothetical protein
MSLHDGQTSDDWEEICKLNNENSRLDQKLNIANDKIAFLKDRLSTACHYASLDPDLIISGGQTRDELRAENAKLRDQLAEARGQLEKDHEQKAKLVACITDLAISVVKAWDIKDLNEHQLCVYERCTDLGIAVAMKMADEDTPTEEEEFWHDGPLEQEKSDG